MHAYAKKTSWGRKCVECVNIRVQPEWASGCVQVSEWMCEYMWVWTYECVCECRVSEWMWMSVCEYVWVCVSVEWVSV